MSRVEQKAQTRAKILKVARELFVEKGYAKTSIRDVAKEAGVAIGSIHVHFKSKKELLLSCFHDQLAGAVQEGFDTLDTEAPLVKQLTHLCFSLYRAYAEHPELSRVMFTASLFPDEPASDPLLAYFLNEVSGLFRNARERGEIRLLPAEGLRAAQGFFAAYMAVLIGGLSGHWGETSGDKAALAWAAQLEQMLRLQLVGLGADEGLLEEVS